MLILMRLVGCTTLRVASRAIRSTSRTDTPSLTTKLISSTAGFYAFAGQRCSQSCAHKRLSRLVLDSASRFGPMYGDRLDGSNPFFRRHRPFHTSNRNRTENKCNGTPSLYLLVTPVALLYLEYTHACVRGANRPLSSLHMERETLGFVTIRTAIKQFPPTSERTTCDETPLQVCARSMLGVLQGSRPISRWAVAARGL